MRYTFRISIGDLTTFNRGYTVTLPKGSMNTIEVSAIATELDIEDHKSTVTVRRLFND